MEIFIIYFYFQDYLSKLRQIRLQNFNERRNVKDKLAGGKVDPKYKVGNINNNMSKNTN